MASSRPNWPRLLLTAALAWYSVAILSAQDTWSALDNVNLPIHETGHLVFGPFGEHTAALGGTLFQLIVPLVFGGSFLARGDRHAASVMLWWLGQNGVNIGRYMADAVVQELPLVGGGEHDWSYLFGEWNLLAHSEQIGLDTHRIGAAVMVAALAWGAHAGWHSGLAAGRGRRLSLGAPTGPR
ncbi:MAG: hypothetical protein IT355_11560 [Gemmatimonadaceae bacterium]|nr:hypothetical protein [Gemmatimonadaceae bacterium]